MNRSLTNLVHWRAGYAGRWVAQPLNESADIAGPTVLRQMVRRVSYPRLRTFTQRGLHICSIDQRLTRN